MSDRKEAIFTSSHGPSLNIFSTQYDKIFISLKSKSNEEYSRYDNWTLRLSNEGSIISFQSDIATNTKLAAFGINFAHGVSIQEKKEVKNCYHVIGWFAL